MVNNYQNFGPSALSYGRLQGRSAVLIEISPRTILPNRCCGCGETTYQMGGVTIAARPRQTPDACDWSRAGPALGMGFFFPILRVFVLGAALFRIGKWFGSEVSGQLSRSALPIPYCSQCKRFGSPRPLKVTEASRLVRIPVHPDFERALRDERECDPY